MVYIKLDNVDNKYPWVLIKTSTSRDGIVYFKTEEKFMGLEGLLIYAFGNSKWLSIKTNRMS